MPFEFIQIPANGQGSAKEELNKLLRGGRIASVKKESVSNGDDSFWAFCVEREQREQQPRREPQQQQPDQQQQQHRVPHSSQLRPTVPDGSTMSIGLNRPPSRSHSITGYDKITKRPPGAGRSAAAGSNALGVPFSSMPSHLTFPPCAEEKYERRTSNKRTQRLGLISVRRSLLVTIQVNLASEFGFMNRR